MAIEHRAVVLSLRRSAPIAAAACLLVALPCAIRNAEAAEGMFLLDRLPAARLVSSGLKIPVQHLRYLSRAVVQLGSGGTASFVSDRGLLATNYHVAFRCLARIDAVEPQRGIMERGYLARSPADEIRCPGYDLRVVDSIVDVTEEVLVGLEAATMRNYAARFEQIRLRKEQLRERCEASLPGRLVCEVAEMNGGTAYYLSRYRRVRDVRLVFAPPRALGKFGGDVDNWMYPRHTADFAFLRAYVDRAGRGSAYSKDARPLRTPVHLKISPHGLKRGSLALVIGFPGRTFRHVTSHGMRFHRQVHVPSSSAALSAMIEVLAARMGASDDARRKYAGLESGLQNAIKYYRMMSEGFDRTRALDRKREEEERMIEVLGDAADRRRAKRLLGEIGRILAAHEPISRKAAALAYLRRLPATIRVAFDLARWGVEKAKPDRMRKEDRYKDKNVYRFVEAAARLERESDLATERALTLLLLRRAQKLPPRSRISSVGRLLRSTRRQIAALRREARQQRIDYAQHYRKVVGVEPSKDPLQTAVDLMYGRSQLLAHGDSAAEIERAVKLRARLFGMTSEAVAGFEDPLLSFARDLQAEHRALREGPLKRVEQYLATALHPRWVSQVKRPDYPDANFTARLSFGSVRDYTSSKTKSTHRYLTGLAGLLKKGTGRDPFLVPVSLKRAFDSRQKSRFFDRATGDIPVNFTTTLDTTGGNSGSPVLDDRGRLVGLLFDGTPESILSDWQYLADDQRSICVDVRFAAYLASLRRAHGLLQELGL